MSKFYKHTTMHKPLPNDGGIQVHIAWIPEEFAKVGKVLKLKDPISGEWDDGWVVQSVYARQAEEFVLEHSQDYKYQRAASDI